MDSSNGNINNPAKKPIICNNCGVLIDHIDNLHFIYQDIYGYWDVCENCYHHLKEYDNYLASLRVSSFNYTNNPRTSSNPNNTTNTN